MTGLTIVPGGLLSPLTNLFSYSANKGGYYTCFGFYTPWCYNSREKWKIGDLDNKKLGVNMRGGKG